MAEESNDQLPVEPVDTSPKEDFSNMLTGAEEDTYEGDDLDLMLDGFSMDDIDDDGLDYDANHDATEQLDASVQDKIRMAMAKDELSETKDADLICMAAAQRIALRKGIPRVPAIFGNPEKCKEFLKESAKGFPPPTHGMLETAKKVFEIGDMAGLAINSMEDCRKYLLSKRSDDSPSVALLDNAFGLADSKKKVVPPASLSSAEALQKWISEHE